VYNAGGELIAEYTSDSHSASGETSYLTTDTLGSVRVVTDRTGSVVSRHDYLPFGEEISSQVAGRSGLGNYGITDGIRQRFTQKERDSEYGLDFFLARYYSAATGRFSTVDPKLDSGSAIQPQGWNRYSYVINNPVNLTDPDGLDWWYIPGSVNTPVWFDEDPRNKESSKGWKRWSERFGYVYRVTTGVYAGAWVALDPLSKRAYISATKAGADVQFQAYVSNSLGLIPMTQADREFLAGVNEGIFGLAASLVNRLGHIDSSSQDYKVGFFIGSLVAAGISITAETVAAIRAADLGADGIGAMRRLQYEGADYHGPVASGRKNPAPPNGQAALDLSVRVKSTSPTRVGIDYEAGGFAVFNGSNGVFHGHVRTWAELDPAMRSALYKAGMVTKRGKITIGSH
jgi:RHS repeat-associated protein